MSKLSDKIDGWVHDIDIVLAEQSPPLAALEDERYAEAQKLIRAKERSR